MSGIEIEPARWYSEYELRERGFPESLLRRARASGLLRASDLGRGQRLYLGSWVTAWLEAAAEGVGR